MASYKKKGQCNIVRKGQRWKSKERGQICVVVAKGKRGKEWIVSTTRDSHHINEGTLLKYFELVK